MNVHDLEQLLNALGQITGTNVGQITMKATYNPVDRSSIYNVSESAGGQFGEQPSLGDAFRQFLRNVEETQSQKLNTAREEMDKRQRALNLLPTR